ncbi:Ltp family lipoprotein [Mycobacterium sp. 141]|uniref:Ltp family lipoprotein n=1 Tax=Mycobacterium sp. 141 TaxID=1120797 RepID=UPI00035C23F0|nr:Ltp family lipoprotein [Mycobacterium sp. 141]
MNSVSAKPASTAHHDALRHAAATSATSTKSRLEDALAAGLLLAISGTALWFAMATAVFDGAGPSVQLAGVVTRMEGHGESHVRALSGPMVPLEPASTVSQRNAVRTAKDYLDYTAFSREGLIKQLEFDDFSTADATFAVDHIAVDWNEQAAKAAKDYLDYSGFSRGGLIDQLEFDGFTSSQAAYGATAAGL